MTLNQNHLHFITAFKDLSTNKNTIVKNKELFEKLNWKEPIYNQVKKELIAAGYIKRSTGRGGAMIFTNKRTLSIDITENIINQIYEDLEDGSVIKFLEKFPNLTIVQLNKIQNKLKKTYGTAIKLDSETYSAELVGSTIDQDFFDNFQDTFKWTDPDEKIAVDRIMELFDYNEIKDLSGEYGKLIRRIVRAESGADKKGTKFQIASSLIMKFGKSLFQMNPEIVESIGNKCKIRSIPKRWRPGSVAAKKFVLDVNFPESFKGEPSISTVASLFFPSRTQIGSLRDFQIEARDSVILKLSKPGNRTLLRMPTGTGKTRTGIESINLWFKHNLNLTRKCVAIWVAHTEELCEQAIHQFKNIYNSNEHREFPVEIFRLWSDFVNENSELDPEQIDRIIGSQKGAFVLVTNNTILNRLLENEERIPWFKELLSESHILVTIDEAHRSSAPTYKNAIEEIIDINPMANIFGLTATPKRGIGKAEEKGTQELLDLFNSNVVDPFNKYANPKAELVSKKILANPRFQEIKTEFDVDVQEIEEFELLDIDSNEPERIREIEDEISKKVDKWLRRRPVIEKIQLISQSPNSRIIYFGSSNNDAELVAWALRRYGISSASLTHETPLNQRRQIIEKFKNGEISVLTNCMILTTGFDNPGISHVIVGRPTLSTVLFEQMIGRGLRGPEFGGTSQCQIWYVRDRINPSPNIEFAYDRIKSTWEIEMANFNSEIPSDLKSKEVDIGRQHQTSIKFNTIQVPAKKAIIPAKNTLFEKILNLVDETVEQKRPSITKKEDSIKTKTPENIFSWIYLRCNNNLVIRQNDLETDCGFDNVAANRIINSLGKVYSAKVELFPSGYEFRGSPEIAKRMKIEKQKIIAFLRENMSKKAA